MLVPQLLSRWTGGLGRPLTGSRAFVPAHLQVRRSRLVYSDFGRVMRLDTSRLLDRFVALADQESTDRDVLEFAILYGPLYLCEHHGLAAFHKPLLMNFSALGPTPLFGIDEPFKYRWCGPKVERKTPLTLSEPIEKWRELATRAKALLLVANAIRFEGDAPQDLWKKADGFTGGFGRSYGQKWAYLDQPWYRLAANLDYWIAAAEICLRVDVEKRSLVASLGSNRLTMSSFSLVATQLLLAITRSEGLVSCAGCGAPFVSSRQPLAGKRVGRWIARRDYCQDCRDAKVPQRDAARDYRNRQRRLRNDVLGS
jgi:hypothetical protein